LNPFALEASHRLHSSIRDHFRLSSERWKLYPDTHSELATKSQSAAFAFFFFSLTRNPKLATRNWRQSRHFYFLPAARSPKPLLLFLLFFNS
jgi:hypothetical protein